VREEEEHADWFESQLEAIKAIGISAYLAQQVDPGSAPS
jgi:bacterioferritin